MDAATLFGLPLEDFRSLAGLLFLPAVAVSAIYLVGVDLLKLPFLPFDVPYRVPTGLTRFAALLLPFLVALCFSVWLFGVRLYGGPKPDIEDFRNQYYRILPEDVWPQATRSKILRGEVVVQEYDGKSDVRIFFNGIRLFGTQVHCIAIYQCRSDSEKELPDLTHIPFLERARELLKAPNQLPLRETLVLRPGPNNYLELAVNDNGVSDCKVEIVVTVTTSEGMTLSKPFSFTNTYQKEYRTIKNLTPFRICGRVGLKLDGG